MDFKEQMIIEYVRHCQEDYSKGHDLYKEYSKKMEKKGLENFDEINHVEMIIKPYLYKWGRMQRVLGQKQYRGWESDIIEQVRLNFDTLENFRKMKFESSNLNDHKTNIINCYESFNKIVDGVAAAKVLHIISPYFFPLWDNGISVIVRKERVRAAISNKGFLIDIKDFSNKIEDFSGKDYFYFMKILQTILEKYKNTFSVLAKSYEKGVLKIMDDFLWMLVHESLSLYL